MDREPTLYEAMDDLREACYKLGYELLLDMFKLVFLPVRFLLWVNGDE